MADDQREVGVEGAAEIAGVSTATARRWMQDGTITAWKSGGAWVTTEAEVHRGIARRLGPELVIDVLPLADYEPAREWLRWTANFFHHKLPRGRYGGNSLYALLLAALGDEVTQWHRGADGGKGLVVAVRATHDQLVGYGLEMVNLTLFAEKAASLGETENAAALVEFLKALERDILDRVHGET